MNRPGGAVPRERNEGDPVSECPRQSVSGIFEEDFGDSPQGLAGATAWLQRTRAYIETNFTDWCQHGFGECNKTILIIKTSVVPNAEHRHKMHYTMTFQVICTNKPVGHVADNH